MKDRSTVVCIRNGKILLVARARSRWSLPGGTIKRHESPLDAALRELEEETAIAATDLTYGFQFGGLNKRHHVFFVEIGRNVAAEPRNEIFQCHWFSPAKVSTLLTSIPTRSIVELFFRVNRLLEIAPIPVAGATGDVQTRELRVLHDANV